MDFSPGRAYGIRLKNKLFSDSPGADLHGWSIATKRLADVAEEEGDIEEIAGDENDAPDPKKWRRGFWKSEKSWEGTGPLPGVINEVVRRHTAQKQAPPPVRKPFRSEVEKALSAAALRLQTSAAKKRRQSARLRQHADSGTDSSSNSDSSSSSSSER